MNINTSLLGKFCGQTVNDFVSKTHVMNIEFKTDHSVDKNGFSTTYTTGKLLCKLFCSKGSKSVSALKISPNPHEFFFCGFYFLTDVCYR